MSKIAVSSLLLASGCLLPAPAFAAGTSEDGPDTLEQRYAGGIETFEGPIVSGVPYLSAAESSRGFFDPTGGDAPAPLNDPFESSNMQLLSWIPTSNFAGLSGPGNDCWGYVSPSGREYALMGLNNGGGFVEITDPFAPQIIETIGGPTSTWHDIKVMGEWAYGVSEGGLGIQVIDLRNIDNGVVTLVRNRQQSGHSSTHNIASNTDSGFVYLCGANIANGGLVAVDVTSNPALPNIVGAWDDFYVHDAQIVSYTDGPYAGREIAFCLSGTGNGSGSTALRIVDDTNNSNMFLLSTISWSGARYSHQGWLSEDRKYIYVNDELDEGQTVGVTTTRIFNVENINSPSFVGTTTSGRAAIDHNLYIHDGYMYQSNYRSGLRVFDLADPENPQQVAWFDTFPGSDSPSFNGAWSNYPFLPSGTIILSDIERGLFLLRLAVERLDIDLVNQAPSVLAPGSDATIEASIDEVGLTLDPSTVSMVVTDSSGTREVAGVPTTGGRFSLAFDNLQCFDEVSYYIESESTEGDLFRFPAAGVSAPLTAIVASNQTAIFSDSFNTNQGWSVDNSGGLTDGQWTRGQPAGGGERGDPGSDFDGNGFAYLTDNVSGNSDVDGGSTALISPAFDGTGGEQVFATYAVWYSNSFGNAPNADEFTVEVSNNNGASWLPLQTIGPASQDSWREFTFRLDGLVTPSASLRLRFTAADFGEVAGVEAAVDAVRIEAIACDQPVACPFDIADDFGFAGADGQVSFGDFLFALTILGPCPGGTPGCDGDIADDFGFAGGDGQVSFGDFLFALTVLGPCP